MVRQCQEFAIICDNLYFVALEQQKNRAAWKNLRSLFSAFVIDFLQLATCTVSTFYHNFEYSNLLSIVPSFIKFKRLVSHIFFKKNPSYMGESSKFPKSWTLEIQILKLAGCLQNG